MSNFPVLVRSLSPSGETRYALGDPLVDGYLRFVAGRCRPNTVRATAHDLKTFFTVVDKAPVEVVAADVFDFLAHQRGDRSVVRIVDGESGLAPATIARRLSTVAAIVGSSTGVATVWRETAGPSQLSGSSRTRSTGPPSHQPSTRLLCEADSNSTFTPLPCSGSTSTVKPEAGLAKTTSTPAGVNRRDAVPPTRL